MIRRIFLLLALWLSFGQLSAWAGVGPENTVVVVNADSWASVSIANHYIKLRNIPSSNVVSLHLSDLADFEQVSADQFRQRVLSPVLEAIEKRGLTPQIDCVAYSSDVPYAVHVGNDVQAAHAQLPQVLSQVASVNGMTYLYRQVLAKDVGYLALDSNRYARRYGKAGPNLTISKDDAVEFRKAFEFLQAKNWTEAEPILAKLAAAHPESDELQYNHACCLARLDRLDDAMKALTRAVAAGWWNARHMRTDEDLAKLRDKQEFKDLLGKIKSLELVVQPAQGFRSSYGWKADGTFRENARDEGYLLSTMLALTSGRGNSYAEALSSLTRSAAADGTAPKGTIYYMDNDDVRSTTRDWGFPSAVAELKKLGVNAEIIEGVLPFEKNDVMGTMVGSAGFGWKSSGSTILPGAICEHLTSMGGVMVHDGGQTPLSEFLRFGAAASAGAVTEPFAIQQKFPTPFIHVYYAQGATLAEAFYQSLAGPYQLLIVGDPLCRPWARIPEVKAAGVENDQVIKGTLQIKPAVEDKEFKLGHFRLYVDGKFHSKCGATGTLSLDSTRFADGYHELSVVAVSFAATENLSRKVVGVRFDNASRSITVRRTNDGPVQWGEPIEFSVSAPPLSRVSLMLHGEEIAAAPQGQTKVTIDSRRLGFGPARIDVMATVDLKTPDVTITAPPIDVNVEMPPPIGPLADAPPASSLVAGLLLTLKQRDPVAIASGNGRSWLTTAKIGNDEPFQVTGYLKCDAADVYQFQIRFAGDVEITIDDKDLAIPETNGWRFIPLQLASGLHEVTINFAPKGSPDLDIRFGNLGVPPLLAERFQHKQQVTTTTTTIPSSQPAR